MPDAIAVYARVSTEDQAERNTIEGQLQFLRDWCALYSIKVYDHYIDDGISGTIPLQDRQSGVRLLRDAAAGCFHEVVVYRLDRLGRSLTSLLDAHERLATHDVTIRSATEPFDTSTSIGRFLFQLLASLAELERATIRERTLMGSVRAIKSGRWVNGYLPLGLDTDDAGVLILSEHPIAPTGLPEWRLIREVITNIAEGSSAAAEARRLTALGTPSLQRAPGGGVQVAAAAWSSLRILSLVHNDIYSGRGIIQSPDGPVEIAAPPIVDASLLEQARHQLKLNSKLAKRNAKNVWPLRGLIRCTCGYNFVGSRVERKGRQWRYYRCNSANHAAHHDGEACGARVINADRLEDYIWKSIREKIENPNAWMERVQRETRGRQEKSAQSETEKEALRKTIRGAHEERERIMALYRRGRISLDEADNQLDQIARESSQAESLVAAIEAQQSLADALEDQFMSMVEFSERMRPVLDEADEKPELQRQYIERLVARIDADYHDGREDIRIFFILPIETPVVAAQGTPGRAQYCYNITETASLSLSAPG